MKTALRSWYRAAIVAVGGLSLLIAGFGCATNVAGGSGAGGSGGTCSGVPDGGSMPPVQGVGGCMAASDVPSPPPKKTCDPCGDIYKECPLPQSQTNDDGEETTIYYFSNPTCQDGVCHYCVTTTTSEDPGVTAAP